MRIGILTPSITSRDAVSNDVLGMYSVLRTMADVRIFAEGWTLKTPKILPAAKVESFARKPDDVVIYHYSRGWEPAIQLLNRLRCRKVIKYHNVTPARFLAPYNPDMAKMCLAGREELKSIVNLNCDLFLSASAYNMRELIAAGADESKSFVVPPFHQVDRLELIKPDPEILSRSENGQVNICTVGRIAPNKGHAELIAAFGIYHHDYNRHSKLIIVGKQETRLARYTALLHAVIKRLKLENAVTFACDVSDAALKSFYNASDIFVTTSEHEGFCVPLVEAMALNVPVVAYATPAVSETIGPAGIVWEERNPTLVAESISVLASNGSLRSSLTATGRRRYQEHFTTQRIAEQFVSTFNNALIA